MVAVQPSLFNFCLCKESTIYTLSRLLTFQKNDKVNPDTVAAMQSFFFLMKLRGNFI